MPLANFPEIKDSKIKAMIWGEGGTGKTLFALGSSKPLVIDLENSTDFYIKKFKFRRVKKSEKDPLRKNATVLTKNIIDEILQGIYPDVETLVIDPVTDLIDNIEVLCTKEYERQALKDKRSILELSAIEKTKFYAFKRDKTREMLDRILSLDMHVILVARAKDNWERQGNKVETNGKTFDGVALLEYLPDVVINLVKEKKTTVAHIKKSRIGDLPSEIENLTWNDLEMYAYGNDDPEIKPINIAKKIGLDIINIEGEKEAV